MTEQRPEPLPELPNGQDPRAAQVSEVSESGSVDATPAWRTRLLRVPEAAEYLAVSRSRVYMLIKEKELASIRTGGSRRVTLGALVDYVDRVSGRDS